MSCLAISFVITGHHVEDDGKLLTEEEILKAGETASDSGKHSPTVEEQRKLGPNGCKTNSPMEAKKGENNHMKAYSRM